MTENCEHKNLFFKITYPMKKNDEGLESLDIQNPYIETICADCGKWLKMVKVECLKQYDTKI